MAAGEFTSSEICDTLVAQDKIWDNPQLQVEYNSDVEALRAVREQQTAKISDADFARKSTISIAWLDTCDIAVEDCDDECTISGDEVQSRTEDLTVDLCKQVTFKVSLDTLRNNMFNADEIVAKASLKAKKELDEWLVQQAIAKLVTFAGTNEVTDAALYQTQYEITNIDDSLWTADLFAYFAMVKAVNRLAQPYMIHGTNFFTLMHNATLNLQSLDQKDNTLKFGIFKQYWDMYNMAATGHTADTFMIDKAAVAFVSTNRYSKGGSPLQVVADTFQYTDQSKALPGVYYDVIKQRTCTNGLYYDTYKYKVNAGVFNNPTVCTAGRTGVLQFRQGNSVT